MRPASRPKPPELSVIVPMLNEADTLPIFLEILAQQRGVDFELILCDGGSSDGSRELVISLGSDLPFDCRICCSPPGRARQFNAGIGCSRGACLLFLHVDSTFVDLRSLAKGYHALCAAHQRAGHPNIGGHFALTFNQSGEKRSWAYFHHAWKARLHRPYCVHGDQGFMLSRAFFDLVGPFDETLPFLEDVRLSASVMKHGEWMLLPAVIGTSARRFETEGFYRRQVLNALLLACEDIGYGDWLVFMQGIYRNRSNCSKLRLGPFFRELGRRVKRLTWRQRLALWRRVGRFVCRNTWQVALMLDTLCHYRKGRAVGEGHLAALGWFDRRVAPRLDRPAGWWLSTVPTWVWFQWHLFIGRWS